MSNSNAVLDPPGSDKFDQGEVPSAKWVSWARAITNYVNRRGTTLNNQVRSVQPITVTASPFKYTAVTGGDTRVIVTGGTVSSINFTRDNGTTLIAVPTSGMFDLSQGDALIVTYTAAPVMTAVPA